MSTLKDIVDRLKSEGQLVRNTGTNSIKTVKEDLRIVTSDISAKLSEQTDKLTQTLDLLTSWKTNEETQRALDRASADRAPPRPAEQRRPGPFTEAAASGSKKLLDGIGNAAGALVGLGLGISGFMAALAIGSGGLSMMGVDYSGLGDALGSFSSAIKNLSPEAAAALAGVAGIAVASTAFGGTSNPLKIAGSMAGLGAGIGGFLVGLRAGDYALSWVGTDFSNIGPALGSFSNVISYLTQDAVVLLGGLVGVAIANAKFGGNPISLAGSMAGIAAGFAGFMGGLVATDLLMRGLSAIVTIDGAGLATAINLFNNSIGMLTPESGLALAGLLGIASKFNLNPLKMATNMAAISAGVAGFLGGLVLADKGISWINEIPAGDGGGLVSAFKLFNDAVSVLDPASFVVLGSIIAAAGALGAATGGAAGAGAGIGIAAVLTGIGAGIAGFVTGIALADGISGLLAGGDAPGESLRQLFTNIFAGVAEVNKLSGIDLVGIGAGMVAIGDGLIKFATGSIADSLAKAGDAILDFFGLGGESAFDQIARVATDADELMKGAEAINSLADALEKISGLQFEGDSLKLKDFATDLLESVPVIEKAIMGGEIDNWGPLNTTLQGLASPNVDYETAIRNIKRLKETLLGVDTSQPQIETSSGQTTPENSFRTGTPGFMDFGGGSLAMLHGMEAVIPRNTPAGEFLAQNFDDNLRPVMGRIANVENAAMKTGQSQPIIIANAPTVAPVNNNVAGPTNINNQRVTSFGGESGSGLARFAN